MVFYIIAAAERADANSGKVDQNIQYKSEEDVARNIKSTRSFQDNRAPSELHKMDVSSRIQSDQVLCAGGQDCVQGRLARPADADKRAGQQTRLAARYGVQEIRKDLLRQRQRRQARNGGRHVRQARYVFNSVSNSDLMSDFICVV